jgi:hypothetical protein
MTSLLDIGTLTEEIPVNGKHVTVYGVTPEGFFYLLEKFPMLRDMFSSGKSTITMEMLRDVAPGCIAHALAVATLDRSAYDTTAAWLGALKKSADVAMRLSAHHQMALFQTALRLTFPDGIGPFMQGVEALADSINRVSGKAPATTSSKRSRSGFETDSRGLRLGKAARSANSVH